MIVRSPSSDIGLAGDRVTPHRLKGCSLRRLFSDERAVGRLAGPDGGIRSCWSFRAPVRSICSGKVYVWGVGPVAMLPGHSSTPMLNPDLTVHWGLQRGSRIRGLASRPKPCGGPSRFRCSALTAISSSELARTLYPTQGKCCRTWSYSELTGEATYRSWKSGVREGDDQPPHAPGVTVTSTVEVDGSLVTTSRTAPTADVALPPLTLVQ